MLLSRACGTNHFAYRSTKTARGKSMRQTVAAAIAASAALAGCHNRTEDSGATVSRNYQVGNFQQIEVAGPYEVNVRTGSGPTVSAQGSESLLGRTTVEVEGDKLVIKPEHSGGGLFHIGWSTHGKATFTITVPQLSGATIAGSGDINIDRIAAQNFDGRVAGSGDLDVGAMDVQALQLSIGGSGDIKAGAGKAQAGEYRIGGSGDIDASAIQTQSLKVSIAGSGGIKARSSGTADISIMGSGDVTVTGGAKCNVSKMGSGGATCS
jgi:hypothetical protein